MACFLNNTTTLDGRNQIKDYIARMGINVCAGELEEIYGNLRMIKDVSSGMSSEEESLVKKQASVKTENSSNEKVNCKIREFLR